MCPLWLVRAVPGECGGVLSPGYGGADVYKRQPHEPFAPQLAAGPVTLLPEHPVVRVLMREWLAQARAISESRHPERLRLLAAAESAGALVDVYKRQGEHHRHGG